MDPTDEFFHEPTDAPAWSESHYVDVISDDGAAFHGRIGFYPNRELANGFGYLLTDEAVYSIRDEAVPPASVHGLVARTEDWTFRLVPETIDRQWRLELEGTLTRTPIDDPVAIGEGEGTPVDGSISLEITNRHDRFHYTDGETFPAEEGADRYEIATTVTGAATIEDQTHSLDGVGERDHSWGTRDWVGPAEWLWISGAFEDGTAYNHLSFWLADHPETRWINGFWYDGEAVHPLTAATVSSDPPLGSSTASAWERGEHPTLSLELDWDGGSRSITADPWATTPLEWIEEDQRALLNRSPARQHTDSGVEGRGFLESMTQLTGEE